MMAGKVYNNFLTLESQCQLFSTLLRVLVGQGRVEAIEKQYNVELYVRLPHQCDLFSLMRRLSGALSPLRVAWIDGQTRMSTWTKIATGALDESVGDDRAVTRNALFRLLPVLPRCIVYRDEDFGCPLELLHKKIGDVLTVKIYTGARASTNEFAPSAVLPLVHIMELSAQLEKSMIDKQPYSILDRYVSICLLCFIRVSESTNNGYVPSQPLEICGRNAGSSDQVPYPSIIRP